MLIKVYLMNMYLDFYTSATINFSQPMILIIQSQADIDGHMITSLGLKIAF